MKLSRRKALATLGTLTVGAGSAGWLRIADIRRRNTDTVSLSEQPPRDAIRAAAQRVWRLDHRADTTVTVLNDGSGDAPYESAHHRVFHQPSRRRTWLSYTTKRIPAGTPGSVLGTLQAQLHTQHVAERGGPGSSSLYLSDGFFAYDRDAPVPEAPDERPKLTDPVSETVLTSYLDDLNPSPIPVYVHEHTAEWEEIDRDAETVSYRITDTDEYAQIPQLRYVRSLGDDCSITVTLDRETGYLTRIFDRRQAVRVSQADDAESTRSYTHEIETDFTEYGAATAPKPTRSLDLDLNGRLQGTLYDLKRY